LTRSTIRIPCRATLRNRMFETERGKKRRKNSAHFLVAQLGTTWTMSTSDQSGHTFWNKKSYYYQVDRLKIFQGRFFHKWLIWLIFFTSNAEEVIRWFSLKFSISSFLVSSWLLCHNQLHRNLFRISDDYVGCNFLIVAFFSLWMLVSDWIILGTITCWSFKKESYLRFQLFTIDSWNSLAPRQNCLIIH